MNTVMVEEIEAVMVTAYYVEFILMCLVVTFHFLSLYFLSSTCVSFVNESLCI